MESPPGEEPLVNASSESNEQPGSIEHSTQPVDLQSTPESLPEKSDDDFLDKLGQLSSQLEGLQEEYGPAQDQIVGLPQDMGNYVAPRSSSEEDLRLENDPAQSSDKVSTESEVPSSDSTSASSSLTTEGLSTPPRRRAPLSGATGAPDFQPIGAEVSAEKARQLKKEVRRLSPIHVSQRERTLAEISLTTSAPPTTSTLSLGQEEEEEEVDGENKTAEDKVPTGASAQSAEDDQSDARLNNSNSNSSNKRRELVIKLSRIDCQSPTNMQPEELAVFEESIADVASVKAEVDPCPFGTSLILERCDRVESNPEQLPNSKEIVEKLHIGDEIEFSSPGASTSTSGVRKRLLSPPPPIFGLSADPDEETGTEVLASMAAAAASSMGILCEDGLTQAIISRLDRPEPFTDDSGESLTLVAARDEVRSDGSDSGLGGEMTGEAGPAPAHESDSDTNFLDRITDDILTEKEKEQLENILNSSSVPAGQPVVDGFVSKGPPSFDAKPVKSSLKRRLSSTDISTDCLDGDEPTTSKRPNLDDEVAAGASSAPKKKRNITFDAVTVYYFPRAQGFTCVPSQGGSTLGMSALHTHAERYSLSEHAAEQRRLHRARVAQLRLQRAAERSQSAEQASSSEDPSDDTDEEPSSDASEHSPDNDCYYFLQPVPTWQRRQLLRAAGVRRIDSLEKDECRDIRASREHCGCACKGYCDPESCPCSRANVKCQVDRAGFPCGCTRDGCANSTGRIEFNPMRVRTHFIHTLMRLKMEKKPVMHSREVEEQHQESHHHHHHHQSRLSMPSLETNNDCLGGGFTSLNYDLQDGTRTESLDLYTIRDDCYPNEDCLVGGDGTQRKINNDFRQQSFQQYGIQGSNLGFQQNPYDYQNQYQSMPSSSRSPFQPQFQPVTSNPGFSHYSYTQDTSSSTSSNACNQNHSLMQQQQHNNSVIYDSPFTQDEITGSQYTNLNPMSSVGKLEPFSELLSARYSYYGDVLEQQPQQQTNQQQQQCLGAYQINGAKMDVEKPELNITEHQEQLNEEDCDENFGEIIKKSMVETVSA